MTRRSVRPETTPTLSFPLAGDGDALPAGPAFAHDAASHAERPLAWGAGLSVVAHGAILAAAVALASLKPEIDLPEPIPIQIVYATPSGPTPAPSAPQAAPRPTPAPAPSPQEVAPPKPPEPAPKPAPAEAARPPAPQSGIALPESPQALRHVAPPPPKPKPKPKFVPPPPVRLVAPTPPAAMPAAKASAARPAPASPPARTRTAPSMASRGDPRPETTPPVWTDSDLGNRPPVYPQLARENNWEGHVLLRAHVTAGGMLDNVAIAKSSGFDILDQAALDAVEAWRFRPARKNGTPAPSIVDIGFTFRLKDEP